MERYRVPTGTGEAELVVKGSRFIGTLGSAGDIDAAQEFVNDVRQRYPDATHHAWAYRMPGTPQEIVASNDDGEPGGTAGRPMLAVLAGSDLYEAVVVGTRYFGGVKLGTGGLVRAYGAAARAAIERAPLGEKVLHQIVKIRTEYAQYGTLRHEAERHGAQVINVTYAQDVCLELAVPHTAFASLASAFRDASSGAIALEDQIVASQHLLRSA